MTIRNWRFQQVLIKHIFTAELILAADTYFAPHLRHPLTNDSHASSFEPYSCGPQTESRTPTTAPNLNINLRINLMHGRKRVSLFSKD